MVLIALRDGIVGRHLVERAVDEQERQGAEHEMPRAALSIGNGQRMRCIERPIGYFEIALLAILEGGIIQCNALIAALVPA